MSLLTGTEKVRTFLFREDYKIQKELLPIDECASDWITKSKNGKRVKSWYYLHQLVRRCYNIPGIPDGTLALMIIPRNVIFDCMGDLGDEYKGEKLKQKISNTATEQQDKAEGKGESTLNKTTFLLGLSAFILFLTICIIAAMKYYRGG